MSEHTALPWQSFGHWIGTMDDETIAYLDDHRNKAPRTEEEHLGNAHLIVRAVNSHEALITSLQQLGQYAAALEMMLGISEEGSPLASARAAIAKARP